MSTPITDVPDQAELLWTDKFRRRSGHPAYVPTPLQQAFIGVVARAMDRGLTNLNALDEVAVRELHIAAEISDPTTERGNWVGRMVFHAKEVVYAARAWAETMEAAQLLRLSPGDELGALLGSDRKWCAGCKVHAVDDSGAHYTIHAKRGTQRVVFGMSASALKDAMQSAYAASKRKTSFEQFVRQRSHLPQVLVQADPREPFYKDDATLARDLELARSTTKVEKHWRAVAREFSLKGGPGSFEAMYGFVAHGQAEVAKAQTDLSVDRCYDGSPSSEHRMKVAKLQLAREQLSVFERALTESYPDWIQRLSAATAGAADEGEEHPPQPAPSASAEVLVLARQINQHIGERVAQATLKRGEAEVAMGQQSQASLDDQVAQIRATWANGHLDGRVVALAQAIRDKNPDFLVRTWAKDGVGITGCEGSLVAFRSLTGLNLLRLSSQERAMALYRWAQWSPQQIQSHQRQLSEERIWRICADRRLKVNAARQIAVEEALSVNVQDDHGRVMPMKWLLDDRISRGFDEVHVTIVRGVGMCRLINRASGQHFDLPKGAVADYVRAALDIRREAAEREQIGLSESAKAALTDAESVELDETAMTAMSGLSPVA